MSEAERKHVLTLIERAATETPLAAMQLTQAAANAANALNTLSVIPNSKKDSHE